MSSITVPLGSPVALFLPSALPTYATIRNTGANSIKVGPLSGINTSGEDARKIVTIVPGGQITWYAKKYVLSATAITGASSADVTTTSLDVPPGDLVSIGSASSVIGPGGNLTDVDANLGCLATTAQGQVLTVTGLTAAPVGIVIAFLNGAFVQTGYGSKSQGIYYSGNGGTTARAKGAMIAGDLPYRGATLENTDTNDKLSLFYFTA